MSKNKGYNSIFFLTTLSVYLGLVLVGASPSVLAQQAAMTGKFEIQNEVDFEDDLDNKPDEEDLFSNSIVRFVQELDRFSKAGRFDWKLPNKFQIEDFSFSKIDDLPAYLGTGSIDFHVFEIIEKTASEIARNILPKRSELQPGDFSVHTVDFEFTFDDGSLSIQTKRGFENEKDAQIFKDVISEYLGRIIDFSSDEPERIVAQNTVVEHENNQVFIVIRLPRGSLNELVNCEKQVN